MSMKDFTDIIIEPTAFWLVAQLDISVHDLKQWDALKTWWNLRDLLNFTVK
jgi:hypothetical protein